MLRRFFLMASLWPALGLWLGVAAPAAQAQVFRFTLRAEPDVIAANGISTTSIFVQVPSESLGRGPISAAPLVRFSTTAGVIESQAQLSGGVARVLLRSSSTPETAIITAFIGASRESIAVEFAEDAGLGARFLEIAAPYTAYNADETLVTAAGKTVLDWGDLRIESDVRLDVDLYSERIWAQGTANGVSIQQGSGAKAKILRGDRLFYDLRRRRGVMRRVGDASNSETGARQEFVGSRFLPPSGENLNVVGEATSRESSLVPPRQLSTTRDVGGSEPARLRVPPPQAQATTDSLVLAPEEIAPPQAQSNDTIAPVTLVPGSLADTPALPEDEGQTRVLPRVVERVPEGAPLPQENGAEGPALGTPAPSYAPLEGAAGYTPSIIELPVPGFDVRSGYWVTARRLRVFPRDKVQFERAAIYFNGKKAFGMPTYVLPLDGSFDPATDLFSFNSSGGIRAKVPFYYQASKSGTGSLTLHHEPGAGFATARRGFSLELDQQYYLSSKSSGRFTLDELGRSDWNLNWQHEHRFNATTQSALYVSMPRHRDLFARASLSKDLPTMQFGLEAFYDRPEDDKGNLRGQFYARMRPRTIGKTNWSYGLNANLIGVQRVASEETAASPFYNRPGGVIIGPGTGTDETDYRSLYGTTIGANLRSPTFAPWKGAQLNANLLATAFNYSDGRSGLAPGLTLSFAQRFGSRVDARLDYTYDRSALGLYGGRADSFTHYVSGTLGARLSRQLLLSAFASKSLQDDSLYGTSDLSYYFRKKWRVGLFADYTDFGTGDNPLAYGWSLGRSIGPREVSLNWDSLRQKIYFEIAQARR